MKVLSEFSFDMLPEVGIFQIERVHPLNLETLAPFESYVRRDNLARLFSLKLKTELAVNLSEINIASNEMVLVGRYQGPLLTEGAITLPEGGKILWWTVKTCRQTND